jgi:hypothetical protein
MTQEELRNHARRQPFQPFRLILTTGTSYDIRYPELILIGQRSAMIGLTKDPGGRAYDHSIKVDLLDIADIKQLEENCPMTREELQNAAHRQPFKPFRIVLTTGATYDIRHPDLIMVGRRSATIGITHQPDNTVYDYAFMVDLFHVVGIEELSVSPPPSSNGPAA